MKWNNGNLCIAQITAHGTQLQTIRWCIALSSTYITWKKLADHFLKKSVCLEISLKTRKKNYVKYVLTFSMVMLYLLLSCSNYWMQDWEYNICHPICLHTCPSPTPLSVSPPYSKSFIFPIYFPLFYFSIPLPLTCCYSYSVTLFSN